MNPAVRLVGLVSAGILAGVLRTIDDRPAWRPQEAVTLEQALHATCVAPAWLSHDERVRGTLVPGRAADLVVLVTQNEPNRHLHDQLTTTGHPHTLLIGGCGCLVAAAWFASRLPSLRERVRPIYIEKGILPAMAADGINAATQLTVPPER